MYLKKKKKKDEGMSKAQKWQLERAPNGQSQDNINSIYDIGFNPKNKTNFGKPK